MAWRRQISYGDTRWKLFDCGMVDFLVKMMRAEFDECPLGDASLWGKTAPFVHWREQQRRRLAGLNPETGEPDPIVQDFLQWPAPSPEEQCQSDTDPGRQLPQSAVCGLNPCVQAGSSVPCRWASGRKSTGRVVQVMRVPARVVVTVHGS